MNHSSSRVINPDSNPHCPDTDFQALSEALQRDMSEAVRKVHIAYTSLLKLKKSNLFVSTLSIWSLEQTLITLDASHLVTTHWGEPLPEVTEDADSEVSE